MNNQLSILYQALNERYGNSSDGVKVFCDKGTDHSYIDFYYEQLSPYKSDINMLEIGVMSGGSLLLWSKFFDKYKINAIDLSPDFSVKTDFQDIVRNDKNIQLDFNVNSCDFVYSMIFNSEEFDVIIDDGDHYPSTQFATFKNYFRTLKTGGRYYIEDVQGIEEFKILTNNILTWLKENFPQSILNVYYGDLNKRVDDIIVYIQKI